MKTKLHLFNVNTDIDLIKEYEDNFISESVYKDFSMFTEGTRKEYRCADKLLYIDNIRNRLHISNFNEFVDDYVQGVLDYQRDVGILENDKFEVEFGYEFAESVFEHSKRNFYKSGEDKVLYNNLVTIIKAVMEYEE